MIGLFLAWPSLWIAWGIVTGQWGVVLSMAGVFVVYFWILVPIDTLKQMTTGQLSRSRTMAVGLLAHSLCRMNRPWWPQRHIRSPDSR